MELTYWEITLLKYYQNTFNAKWIRVYRNNHIILDTKVKLYNVYKRRLRRQPRTGQVTYTRMFKNLKERDLYFIADLLKSQEGINC